MSRMKKSGETPMDPQAADMSAAARGVRTDMVKNVRGVPRRYEEMRILATRYWPRGRRREDFTWMRCLSPTADLLRLYKSGEIDWERFAGLYAGQIMADKTARMVVSELHDIAKSGKRIVVLYCHEPPGEPCHRHILREMVAAGRADMQAAMCARFEDCRVDGAGGRTAALHGADLV